MSHIKSYPQTSPPFKYCECGCGNTTFVSAQKDTKRGWGVGIPHRFLPRHAAVKQRMNPLSCYKIDAGGCWVWQKTVDGSGYGTFKQEGKSVQAHRWFYALLVKPIDSGKVLDHLCKNRRCVNPNHLEEVTLSENTRRGHETTKKMQDQHRLLWWWSGEMSY